TRSSRTCGRSSGDSPSPADYMRREISDAEGAAPPEPRGMQPSRRAPHTLVFGAGGVGALCDALLADAPIETARFLLARPVHTPNNAWRLLVYDAIEV